MSVCIPVYFLRKLLFFDDTTCYKDIEKSNDTLYGGCYGCSNDISYDRLNFKVYEKGE